MAGPAFASVTCHRTFPQPQPERDWLVHHLVSRSGGRWRDLPERYGNYQTAKRRCYRWIEMGVLKKLFEALVKEADRDWATIDSTSIRA